MLVIMVMVMVMVMGDVIVIVFFVSMVVDVVDVIGVITLDSGQDSKMLLTFKETHSLHNKAVHVSFT